MKTTVYLIRHGESLGNRKRLILGSTDLGLTELGEAQAEATGKALADISFDAIYSSDLSRAMSTAMPHARLRGMSVVPDERLREMYFGDWEGISVDDAIAKYGEKFTVEWKEQFGIFRAPGGESTPELAERMYGALVDIASRHPGGRIIVASHAGAIRALWGKLLGIEPIKLSETLPFPSNASYSVVEYDAEVLIPVEFSVDAHLADMRTTWKD